jgi:hydroxymethylpyrimidine kinase / phosphomethylpyrimidine kinase / thiamine-phosphate diphosphorylase
MRTVLTIAGSDSIGGAGVQADLKAIASLDLHGASALTAITAQNTKRVVKIVPLSTKDVLAQIDAVLDDAIVSAIKTGMLYSADIARTVAKRIKDEGLPLVVDPVLIAGVGDKLCSKDLLDAMKKDLFPLATVVTPNRHEAEELASMTIDGPEAAKDACMVISELGPRSVLIKGGHFEGDHVIDVLFHEGSMIELTAPRSPNKVHGGGCTLASYIAGDLARGMDIRPAVIDAKRRITDAIALSYQIGGGMNAVNPMASKQKDALREDRIESLRSSIIELESRLPASCVLEDGCEFVYSLPAPQNYSEICGIDGKIVVRSRRPLRVGDIRFDGVKDLARIMMVISRRDPRMMSALTLRSTERNLARLRENGLSVMEVERKDGSKGKEPAGQSICKLMGQTDFVPDIVSDGDGMGMQPMMMVIGESPADVLLKIRPVLQ